MDSPDVSKDALTLQRFFACMAIANLENNYNVISSLGCKINWSAVETHTANVSSQTLGAGFPYLGKYSEKTYPVSNERKVLLALHWVGCSILDFLSCTGHFIKEKGELSLTAETTSLLHWPQKEDFFHINGF